jgi:hypothetical protein
VPIVLVLERDRQNPETIGLGGAVVCGQTRSCIVLGCRRPGSWVEVTYKIDGGTESDRHWLCNQHDAAQTD